MSKFILTSIMLALIVIPTRAARDAKLRRGLKKAITQTLLFDAFYAFALIYLWGRW